MPPSRKCSPPTFAGGSSPGTAALAITASTTRPSVNQCSVARSMLAAQHWNSTARSANVVSPNSETSRWRRGSESCRWVPVDSARRACRSGPSE